MPEAIDYLFTCVFIFLISISVGSATVFLFQRKLLVSDRYSVRLATSIWCLHIVDLYANF